MVSTRAVLIAAIVPLIVTVLVIVIMVIGRARASDGPDCVERTGLDGSDALVCGGPATAPSTTTSPAA